MNKRISFMLVMALVLGLAGTAYPLIDLYTHIPDYSSFSPRALLVGSGRTFNVDIMVKINNFDCPYVGSMPNPIEFTVCFYASRDTSIDLGDYFLGSETFSTRCGSYLVAYIYCRGSFPSNIPAGEYYVGWIIDPYDWVPESDESNNRAYIDEYKLIVKLENNPPVARDDTYITNQNTDLSIPAPGVLGNDTDLDGDPLTAVNFSYPSHCDNVVLRPDGSFFYSPEPSYNGTDSFTYQASDLFNNSNVVTVTITVGTGNQPPRAMFYVISPISPNTDDSLSGSYIYDDANGDPESGW